jgi:hypothetical protein
MGAFEMDENYDSKIEKEIPSMYRVKFGRTILMGVGSVAMGIILSLFLNPLGGPPVASDDIPSTELTFSRDIVPILQANCQECHRPNGIGPFPLLTYSEVKPFAPLIKEYTERRIMPPWKAVEGYGEFKNDRRLSQKEIEIVGRWVDAGAPEGNPLDGPSPIQFPEGWQLGTPDLVLDPGGDFKVKKSGRDVYRSFVLSFNPEEDVWISAIEVIPGAQEVVHHVGIYLDTEGVTPNLDDRSPGLGFPTGSSFIYDKILDLWTPGGTPDFLAQGTGLKIPANSYLVMEVHYAPARQMYLDRTRIGLYFAKEPVDKQVRLGVVGNRSFEIPAGARNHEVTARQRIKRDIHLVSVWPHMHNLGKEMKVWATLPENTTQPIIWVQDYEFNWQQVYAFKEPLALPRGSSINLVAYYDNSEDNLKNPYRNPRTIRFGQRAKDEMCYFYYYHTVDAEHLTQGQVVER